MTTEEKREYNQAYYLLHREKLKRDTAAYSETHKASLRVKALERYQRVRDQILQHSKEYNSRPEVREHRKCYNREYHASRTDEEKKQERVRLKLYRQNNRQLINESNRKYQQENPEKFRAMTRAWQKKNRGKANAYDAKRRAAEIKATIDPLAAQWFYEVVHNQDFLTCAYCYKTITPKQAHVDHIIPINKGGEHGPNNFCVACSNCNLSKGEHFLEKWPSLPERVKPLLSII